MLLCTKQSYLYKHITSIIANMTMNTNYT